MDRADKAGVYLLIAAALTPFAWIVVGGQSGLAVLAFVWIAAAIGIVLNVLSFRKLRRASAFLFLLISWALIGAADGLLADLSRRAVLLICLSVWLFSVSLFIRRWDTLPFQDAVWRAVILLSTVCLYAAVYIELTAP